MRGQLCVTATPTPCWAACSRREARRWSWRARRCRAGQRGPPPLARPVCRRAAGSVTLAGPQSQTTATSHGVRSGSEARLVALSRGAAQVAGEPALTGQGSELWRHQDGTFQRVVAPWRGRGSVRRVQTRAPPRRAWRRWGREWGKSWGQVGGESGSDGGREGDLLAASIRAGAGATFKWCLVAQHLLSVGFSAQRECEVLLVERRHRVPHRLVRHLKLGALCLALLCAANRRHVRPPLARERILRSVLRLTLRDLEQPLLRRAARRGAGPVQSGGRVGAGWVQGVSRIGPEAR